MNTKNTSNTSEVDPYFDTEMGMGYNLEISEILGCNLYEVDLECLLLQTV